MTIMRKVFVAVLCCAFLMPFVVLPEADPAIQAALAMAVLVVEAVICAFLDKPQADGHVVRRRRE